MLLRCSIYFIFTGQPLWAAEGTRVFDEAGLFSAEEVQELETRIDEVRDSRDADLAVLTVEDAQGESAESYADDFYDSHGLGVGDDASGILLRSIWTTGRYTFLPPGMR